MSYDGPRELEVLDRAVQMLAQSKSLEDIKSIRDKAEAARTYARAAKLGLDLQNQAAEVKLLAERKAGQFLTALKLRGGNRKSKGHDAPLKLEDMGISRDQSKRWQHVSSISERDFRQYLKAATALGQEVTSAGLMRVAKQPRNVPTKRTTKKSGSAPLAESRNGASAPHEQISELMNHCQLLSEVLRPVYEESEIALKRAEKRIVGRLLAEMAELIQQLNRSQPQANRVPSPRR